MHRSRPRRRLSRLLAIVAVAGLVASCGPSTAIVRPSPSGAPETAMPSSGASQTRGASVTNTSGATPVASDSSAALYASIEADVERFRELKATQKLEPTILDEAGVRDYMTKAFDAQVDPVLLANTETLLKHLGMLAPGVSLRKLELDLQSSQVIGFYDTKTKKLYLVSQTGQVGPTQKTTFAHEFTHALQDQNFGLESLAMDTPDQGDRNIARTALIEGDASLAMTQWAQARLTMAEIFAMTAEAADSSQQRLLDSAPAILRESMTFPYFSGLSFIQREYNHGGWAAVDRIYKDPPASTSQIIHPELYEQHVQPIPVTLPQLPPALDASWKRSFEDTMGEFQLGVWLANGGNGDAQNAARAAVATWGGDRIGMYDGPDGRWAVVLRTAWRSADGQAAFFKALAEAPHAAGSVIRSCQMANDGVDVVIASDTPTLEVFSACTPQG